MCPARRWAARTTPSLEHSSLSKLDRRSCRSGRARRPGSSSVWGLSLSQVGPINPVTTGASTGGRRTGDDESHIVVLFGGAEFLHLIHDCSQQVSRRQLTMPLQRFGQALLSELFSVPLKDSVMPSVYRARASPQTRWHSPIEQSHCLKSPRTVRWNPAVPQNYCREARGPRDVRSCVTHALRLVVIFGKEERGVGAVGRVVVEQLVHASQQALRIVQANVHWLRRLAWRLAIRRAPAIPFPEISPAPGRAVPDRDSGSRSSRHRPVEPECRRLRSRAS